MGIKGSNEVKAWQWASFCNLAFWIQSSPSAMTSTKTLKHSQLRHYLHIILLQADRPLSSLGPTEISPPPSARAPMWRSVALETTRHSASEVAYCACSVPLCRPQIQVMSPGQALSSELDLRAVTRSLVNTHQVSRERSLTNPSTLYKVAVLRARPWVMWFQNGVANSALSSLSDLYLLGLNSLPGCVLLLLPWPLVHSSLAFLNLSLCFPMECGGLSHL